MLAPAISFCQHLIAGIMSRTDPKSAPASSPSAATTGSNCCWRIRAARSGAAATRAPGRSRKALWRAATLLACAKREFNEETGLSADGPLHPAARRHGRRAAKSCTLSRSEADFDLSDFSSNEFEMEWPPRSGQRQRFPEIDRVAYFDLVDRARARSYPDNASFIEELLQQAEDRCSHLESARRVSTPSLSMTRTRLTLAPPGAGTRYSRRRTTG